MHGSVGHYLFKGDLQRADGSPYEVSRTNMRFGVTPRKVNQIEEEGIKNKKRSLIDSEYTAFYKLFPIIQGEK
jgi:hypothetical protein